MDDLDPMRTTLPHPDHFDPTKFGPNGNRIGAYKNCGRKAGLRPDDAEQLAFLEQIVRVATKDRDDFLVAHGYVGKHDQAKILSRLRNGWRPKK